MLSLLQHAASNGFAVPDILPDSKVHRFARNPGEDKDAWYVCHQAHSHDGSLFHVLIYSDWREGVIYKTHTLKGATSHDNTLIAKEIERAQAAAKADQERQWEETAKRAGEQWDSFGDAVSSAYLTRKQVKPYSLKQDGDTLLVPVRDINGKLWGWQRITDTEKKFLYGTKVKGHCHILGTLDTEAFLVEGYATGASIHEATSIPTVIAFNAGNLSDVAAAILKAHPKLKLTVCADNDQWTPGNPGLKNAAKCGASKVITPRFKSLDTRPTDFNDLHVLEGLEEVRSQIQKDKSPRQYILPLGHKGDLYYYTSSSNRQIVEISRGQHSKAILVDLMPLAYWEGRYPGATGANFSAAQDDLMQQARAKGIYDEENIRGVGVWHDAGRYVVNLGDGLFTNERLQVDDFDSNFVYEIGKRLPEPIQEYIDLDIKLLPKLIDKISFKATDSKAYFLGLLTVAPVAGALAWRPHGWLNGGSGTGKSTIMQVVSQILGPYKHYFQGQTTEAGVRQSTRNDSKAVMIDEFEADDERGSARINLVLELVRQASSETDGHVAKGSPGGNAVTARPKFSAIFSSIRMPTLTEADIARICDLELERHHAPEQFDEFKLLAAKITPEFSNAYISRTIRLLPVLQQTVEIFWDILRRKHSARIGQQFGTLLAGAWIAENDCVVDREWAEKVCDTIKLEDAKQASSHREEVECLDLLMNSLIFMPGGAKQSVRELVGGDLTATLNRHGLIVEDGVLWVASNHPEIKRIFKDSRWAAGWSKSLARLEGAVKKSKYFVVADKGKAAHAIGVPMDLVLETQ